MKWTDAPNPNHTRCTCNALTPLYRFYGSGRRIVRDPEGYTPVHASRCEHARAWRDYATLLGSMDETEVLQAVTDLGECATMLVLDLIDDISEAVPHGFSLDFRVRLRCAVFDLLPYSGTRKPFAPSFVVSRVRTTLLSVFGSGGLVVD